MDIVALAIHSGVTVFGAGVSYGLLRAQVSAAAKAAEKATQTLEALHSRVDNHTTDIAILKRDTQQASREIENGIAELKTAIAALHSRIDDFLRATPRGRKV
jgi:hypothetical protein